MAKDFRVVCGIGADTSYETFDDERDARNYAAIQMKSGTASQVAVEQRKNGEWSLSEIHKHGR